MNQVFISYSRKDLDFVERLAKDLKAAGLEVWYDLSDLEIGVRWGKEIQQAIRLSKYFVVVLSPNSAESDWVEREYLYASKFELKIIPFVYKPCDLPLWCLNIHYIDVQKKSYKHQLAELLDALEVEPDTGVVITQPTQGEKLKATTKKSRMPAWGWVLGCLVLLGLAIGLTGGLVWAITLIKSHPTPTATSPPGFSVEGLETITPDTQVALSTSTKAVTLTPVIIAASPSPLPQIPQEISENSPHPVIAIGPNNQIYLAWADTSAGYWEVYFASSSDGGQTFSKPILVDGAASLAREHPSLAIGPDGRIHIAWEDIRSGNWDIYYAYSEDGTTFSSAVRINDDATQTDQMNPTLAIGSDGTLYLAWQDYRNGDWDIYTARSTNNGEIFGENIRANVVTQDQQVTPAIGVDSRGRAHIVWADDQSGSYYVYYARSEDAGFSRGRVVGTGLMADLSGELPSLIVGPDDKIHVAWANAYILHNVYSVPLYLPVYAVSVDGGDTFSSPRQAGNGYQYVSVRPNETTIAVNGMAIHVILTTYSPRDGSLIWDYRSMDGGLNFKDPVSVAQSQGGDAMHYPVAVFDQAGHIHMLWAYARGDEWDIYYARSTDGGNTFSEGVKVSGEK